MRHKDIQEEMPEGSRSKNRSRHRYTYLEITIREVMTEPIRAELKML